MGTQFSEYVLGITDEVLILCLCIIWNCLVLRLTREYETMNNKKNPNQTTLLKKKY